MGALDGVKVVEFAALGPAALASMLLADMGAGVIRVERPEVDPAFVRDHRYEQLLRGRRSITVDLRKERGRGIALELIGCADVLIEGGRPGGMEKLGLGPDPCLERNPRLVYGRLTGWGQTGPRARTAGHDINYISLTGALHAIGEKDRQPIPPLGLVGDFGGGALFLALGVCAALVERQRSGRGDVIDAAMVDGVASLMTPLFGWLASGEWTNLRESNRVDGGAPFYRAYRCADGKYVAVGAIEQRFFGIVAKELGVDGNGFGDRFNRSAWPAQVATLEQIFLTNTRDHWAAVFADTDGCVSPVLDLSEACHDSHLRARGTFLERDGMHVPAPAPRFARSPSKLASAPVRPGEDGRTILGELGLKQAEIEQLQAEGAVQLPACTREDR
jgi:alpha-methylacyl-CoA racemase